MCERINDPCKGVEWGDVCLHCTMRDEVSNKILAIQKEMAKKRLAQNEPRILDERVLETHDVGETMEYIKPGEATQIVLNVIRTVDFDTLENTFEYENTDGEAIIIDKEGVTYHSFTMSKLSMMPEDDGFDEMFEKAITVPRDNIGLLAIWLLNNTCLSPL